VILLQYLYFRSQPNNADDHAVLKDKNLGMIWTVVLFVYSASLVALGVALTLFVLSFSSSSDSAHDDDPHRRTLFDDTRRLAGGVVAYPAEEMEQRAAHVFSISLALVYVSMDLLSFLHVGWEESKLRCYCQVSRSTKWSGVTLVVLRAALVTFVATLCLWISDPQTLAGAGLGATILQVVLRKLGAKYLSEEKRWKESSTDPEAGKWPNVTHARAEPALKKSVQ
jgi:hypothetical protein